MKYLLLDNIRSAYNVGAIFRTADGAGVAKVIIGGYTPAPTDRFGRVQAEIKKTSLGASETMTWEKVDTLAKMICKLQSEGFTVVAVEQTPNAQSLPDFVEPTKVAYVLGNEIEGVGEDVLALVDTAVEIPMLGQKESLNVSVAAGIVLYHGVSS